MKYEVTLEGRTVEVDVVRHGDGWKVSLDGGEATQVDGSAIDAVAWRLSHEGRTRVVEVSRNGDMAFVLQGDTPLRGEVVDPRERALDHAGGGAEGVIKTQMPGAIVRVLVEAGQDVGEGDVLLVVEAMKMENEFKAPFAGTVVSVDVNPGDAVESGTTLVVLEPAEG